MSDLISRESITKHISEILADALISGFRKESISFDELNERIQAVLKNEPVAYDVDKVIEQMKCDTCSTCPHEEYCNANYHEDFWERLREFVKAGGTDENY